MPQHHNNHMAPKVYLRDTVNLTSLSRMWPRNHQRHILTQFLPQCLDPRVSDTLNRFQHPKACKHKPSLSSRPGLTIIPPQATIEDYPALAPSPFQHLLSHHHHCLGTDPLLTWSLDPPPSISSPPFSIEPSPPMPLPQNGHECQRAGH